ncbi:MAG TPA: hypothetical protein VEG44_09090 [Candidatus Acidoferrales bacterium]|nr:hypothetical protein [Candidatus Acidoferrales bacterium]
MEGNGQKPWNRLPNETGEAYLAFCVFLNLGSQRSLHKVAQEIEGRPIEKLNAWADRFDWIARTELCEHYLEEEFSNYYAESLNNGYVFDETAFSQRERNGVSIFSTTRIKSFSSRV